MSSFLKQKVFNFNKDYSRSPKSHRKSPYHLRLSTQINIAKLKFPHELEPLDYRATLQSSNPLKNMGLGVTEKKKFPVSSVCEVINFSDNHDSQRKNSINILEHRKRNSISELRKFKKMSFDCTEKIDKGSLGACNRDISLDTPNGLYSTTYNSFNSPINPDVNFKNNMRKTYMECKQAKLFPKALPMISTCVSVQTEDAY
ncbi:hypothetical protein SteCoe_18805 [Stentor coeruleus]|uniref:Uncharacterized protein n=1 Tax=Stentor coeruleus TaxID=5963 RepID=A0A1R2BW94_9CILI|nr:hypothetical protein SteCoe_18805 [Stentor coeruleus]